MKFHKIIFFILISLISNKIFSKANNYELTMECIDGANKLTKYTKFKNNICMINSSNQENCKQFTSSDDLNLTYVTEDNDKIEIIDFKNKKITSTINNDFTEFNCQNFESNITTNKRNKIKDNLESLSNKTENINLKNAKEVFLNKKIELEKLFYDSLFVWNFNYFQRNIEKIENMRKEITVIKNKGNFIDAIKKIDKTELEIKKTNKKLEEDFNNFFSNAKSFYKDLSYLKADENIKNALKLKPNVQEAKKLRTKIKVLPEKIQILENLETARNENNKKKELLLMQKLSQIEKNPKLDDEIKNLSLTIAETEFAKKINKAEKFFKDGNIKDAENFLIKAKKILPNRPEINLFEDKLDKLKEEKIKKDLLFNFNIASSNDDWETSLLNLKKIENIENNDAFIREKIEMTEEILSLKKSLKSHSKNLHRFTNQKFKNVVLSDLKSSEKYLDISPSLLKNYLEVSDVIKKSEIKINVKIVSDNETYIEIRGIGKVGKVEEKIIQLPPGEYYFIGKKKGFRDIFLDINLTGNEPVQLKIICTEKI
tara:strand:- start:3333 stop:4958 length:1626 start_codon:yes stop_codon:yes gene_type:complete